MSTDRANADDLEDVSDAAGTGRQPAQEFQPTKRPNAFTELMKPKKEKKPSRIPDGPTAWTLFSGRDGLAAYTTNPASFPGSRVIDYDEDFVVIQDLFPKALVHMLILPCDPKINILRPQEAFDDAIFLERCKQQERRVRKIAAEELRRIFGRSSRAEQERLKALEMDELPDEVPHGRDWAADIKSGIHANPSMNHLHIHVLSRDMMGNAMKKKNHYLSFTTDFFVGLDQFPLAEDDRRRSYKKFPEDMLCWRCGQNFGNKFSNLTDHLGVELEEWKRE